MLNAFSYSDIDSYLFPTFNSNSHFLNSPSFVDDQLLYLFTPQTVIKVVFYTVFCIFLHFR